MGIHLDWEVESDAGWEEVGEDPHALERRLNRRRSLYLMILVAALLAVGGAVAVALRLQHVRGQLTVSLKETIAAETLALRLGDKNAFLRVQANISRWRRYQENVFEDYQEAAPNLTPDGEIVDMDVRGGDARVVLRETLDGDPYEVVWFYHHDDTGWYHVPDIPDYWGEMRHIITAYADVAYVPPDELYAETLAARIDAVIGQVCARDVCGSGLAQLPVRVEPGALTYTHWTGDDAPILDIRSPQSERRPAGQSPELISDEALQRLLVTGWVRTLLAGARADADLYWLEQHLVIWVNHSLDPSVPSSNLFTPLEETYGADFVPRFLARVQGGQDVIAAFSAAIADPPLAPSGEDDLAALLTAYLRVEFALRATGYDDIANDLFVAVPYRTYREGYRSPVMSNVAVSSIQVLDIRLEGDLLWAEIIFRPADEDDYLLRGSLLGSQPFRQVDGRWLRVEPTIDDWGARVSARRGDATIAFHELDRDYALQALTFLEEDAYPQIVEDFGLGDPLPLDIVMTPDPLEYEAVFALPREESSDRLSVVMPSPYLYVLRVDTSVENAVRRMAATVLLHEIFARQTGKRVYDSIRIALIDWEMTNIGLSYWDYYGRVISPATFGEADDLTLDSLWGNEEDVISRQYALRHAAAEILVDVVVERYGADVVPGLVANLAKADSTTDWLELSGVDPASVQDEWRARVDAMLAALD